HFRKETRAATRLVPDRQASGPAALRRHGRRTTARPDDRARGGRLGQVLDPAPGQEAQERHGTALRVPRPADDPLPAQRLPQVPAENLLRIHRGLRAQVQARREGCQMSDPLSDGGYSESTNRDDEQRVDSNACDALRRLKSDHTYEDWRSVGKK